jgi:cleavage and polyadenylation specificity factor subunit 5
MAASSDVQGLKRKLSSKLSVLDDGEADAEEEEDDWQVTLLQAE